MLCENVLGLCPISKHRMTGSSLNVDVASELKLLTSDSKGQNVKEATVSGPDYSDEPKESPFYNYDSIAFGRNGQIVQICAICKKHFCDFDALVRHHTKKHSASVCSYLEAERGHNIEELHFTEPSNVGALAVTDPGLDNISEVEEYKCTHCDVSFKTISKLHVHIVNCSSIDPMYGAQKSENKIPLKKKLQRKIFSLFGSSNDAKSNASSKQAEQKSETQSPKRVFTGCRKRTSVILPDSPLKLVNEQKSAVLAGSGYNPLNHVRRRELTEVLDTLTCEACGLKFKTIIVLERHVKYCTKKEKFKTIQPMACPLMDESLEKIKNMCLYCNKNFTYTKSLLNHFQDFCPVKRNRLDRGALTEQDKHREAEIIERIQKADEEKALKQKEIDNRPKRNISWQVGRKSKRKGHSWTNIKKRNQQRQTSGGLGTMEGSDENEESESGESSSELEETDPASHNSDSPNNASVNMIKHEYAIVNDIVEGSMNEPVGRVLEITTENSDNKSNIQQNEKHSPGVDTGNQAISKKTITVAGPSTDIHDLTDEEAKSAESNLQQVVSSSEMENSENTEQSCTENEETVKTDSPVDTDCRIDVNNTSLNCTARYTVNVVKPVKKYRPIAPKPSFIVQCAAKKVFQLNHSDSKRISKSEQSDSKQTSELKPLSGYTAVENIRTNLSAKEESAFHLAEQGLVTGKRKRERVGKVEEFLNAFRRKRKKKDFDQLKSANPLIIINPTCSELTNIVQDFGNNNTSQVKAKECEENNVNKYPELPVEKQLPARTQPAFLATENCVEDNTKTDLDNSGFVLFDLPAGTTSSSTVKRAGRPPKQAKCSDENGKKRGRPLGSGKPYKNTDDKVGKVTEITKRRRGRPRKSCPLETNENTIVEPNMSPLAEADNESFIGQQNNNLGKTEDAVVSERVELDIDKNHSDTNAYQDSQLSNSKRKANTDITIENVIDLSLVNNVDDICDSDLNENLNREAELVPQGSIAADVTYYSSKYKINEDNWKENSDGSLNKDNVNTRIVSDDSVFIETKQPIENIYIKENIHCRLINSTENLTKLSTKKFDGVNKSQHDIMVVDNCCSQKMKGTLKDHETGVVIKNESYDEIDGHVFEMVAESFENHTEEACEMSNSQLKSHECCLNQNLNQSTYISEQISDHYTGEVRLTDDENVAEEDYQTKVIENMNGMETPQLDTDSCVDKMNTDKVELEEPITDNSNIDDLNETVLSDSERTESERTEDSLEQTKMDEHELRESDIEDYNEQEFQFEPVLSPSERVKMNRRTCKKVVELSSPVWVKRTKLHKGKTEKKVEDRLNDTMLEIHSQDNKQKLLEKNHEKCVNSLTGIMNSENEHSDPGYAIGRKRKLPELDTRIDRKSKHSKKGTASIEDLKKNTMGKKAKSE